MKDVSIGLAEAPAHGDEGADIPFGLWILASWRAL
jgi:hypothetical protein